MKHSNNSIKYPILVYYVHTDYWIYAISTCGRTMDLSQTDY